MSRYWSSLIQNLDPYVPGEQPKDKKYIKLNTNENPYPPSPAVIDKIKRYANEDLRLYPDPEAEELKNALADYYRIDPKQVFVGNGSDEVLAFSFMAFFDRHRPILFPDITYSFYRVWARLFNLEFKLVELDENLSLVPEKFLIPNGGIIFPNPNALTGKYLPLKFIREILSYNRDVVVIIDEAYIDFGGESAITLIDNYPNLLIVRTFSKSRSLAGMRIGFAAGSRELIAGLETIKNCFNSYTLDRLAMVAAIEAIKDDDYFTQTRNKIIATREKTAAELQKLGFSVVPSQANFLFITHPNYGAADLYLELKNRGILVRYFNHKRVKNYLRVTIGTDEEMELLIDTLKHILH